jgi:spore coat polysaccharide biosynthesis predicted glycosyltransferase SpsG
MTAASLLIRANATPEIGAGHLMRCISFAESWKAERLGDVYVWGQVSIPFVKQRLENAVIEVVRGRPSNPVSVLLVDSYDIDFRESAVRATAARLSVLMDDVGQASAGFDVIWNPNAYVADGLYAGFAGTIISGESTIPIRSGLPRWSPASSAVAITLGGTRPPDWLVAALHIWSASLSERPVAGRSSWTPPEWEIIAPNDTWTRFANCSMLISSAGSTVWEAANVGIPVSLIVTAENQRLVADWATARGITVLDAIHQQKPEAFAASLSAAVASASILPYLESGGRVAARRIHQLLSDRDYQ